MRIPTTDELRERPAWVAYGWAAVAGGQQLGIYAAYALGWILVAVVLAANIAGWVAGPILIYLAFKSIESERVPKEPQDDTRLMWACGAMALAGVLGAIGGAGWWWTVDDDRYLALNMMSFAVSLFVMLVEIALFATWWTVRTMMGWIKVRAGRGDASGNAPSGAPAPSSGLVVRLTSPTHRQR